MNTLKLYIFQGTDQYDSGLVVVLANSEEEALGLAGDSREGHYPSKLSLVASLSELDGAPRVVAINMENC